MNDELEEMTDAEIDKVADEGDVKFRKSCHRSGWLAIVGAVGIAMFWSFKDCIPQPVGAAIGFIALVAVFILSPLPRNFWKP